MDTRVQAPSTYSRQIKNNHADLRLVLNRDSTLLFVSPRRPRRYAQSTSGHSSSQVTRPPDSRSMFMASRSPHGRARYDTFRKCPHVVSQRTAKESRSDCFMVDRYDFRSMAGYHQTVIHKSTPFGKFTEWCSPADNASMYDRKELARIRRDNLRRLIERDFQGNQSAFARAYDPENPSQSRINTLLNDEKKSFGEETSWKVEAAGRLLPGQISIPDSPLLLDPAKTGSIPNELQAELDDVTDPELARELLHQIREIKARHRRAKRRAG